MMLHVICDKEEDEFCSSSFFLVPLLLGGARGRLPSANTAGDSQAGGDGGQDGCYCLNDEFPSFLFHVVH